MQVVTGVKLREPHFEFGESVPNHYMSGNSVVTHLTNAFHTSIPAGERFIIGLVSRVAEDTMNPDIKSFLGQEENHAAEHGSFTKILESQGYFPTRIARAHDRLYAWMDQNLPTPVNLSMAAAVEHYTADLGYKLLSHPEIFNGVQPHIVKLLLWHAAEEVEHRSVVFDVLKNHHPSYLLRILGFFLASLFLGFSTLLSFADFAFQDPSLTPRRLISDFIHGLGRTPLALIRSMLRLTIAYLRPDFHPSHGGDIQLAMRYLEKMEKDPKHFAL